MSVPETDRAWGTMPNVARRDELAMLRETMLRLGTSLDLTRTLEAVLDGLTALVPCAIASMYLDGIVPDALVRVAQRALDDMAPLAATQPRPLDGSVTGWAYRHRQSLLLPDLVSDARTLRGAEAPPPGLSSLVVPLLVGDRAVGTLIASRRGIDAFTRHDLGIAESFAPLAAQAVANARLHAETERAKTQTEAVLQGRERDNAYVGAVAQACNSAADGPAILQGLADLTAQWADDARVVTIEGERATLAAYASRTPDEDTAIRDTTIAMYATVAAAPRMIDAVRRLHAPMIEKIAEAPDSPQHAATVARSYHTKAFIPLRAEGKVVGVLGAGARAETPPFDAQAIATLELVAEQAGLAITKERLLRQVRAQVMQLEEANRHKDDFLASLSHELRTPLNAILGFGELIEDGIIAEPEELREVAHDIVISGRLLLDQVNGLLDMARVGSGRMEFAREAVDIRTIAQQCERIIAPLISAKGQQLTFTLPPDLPPVVADGARLHQALLNLLTNAHKFTPEGGSIAVVGSVTAARVAITVRDTGIGIAPEYAPIIFEPFRRVETGYARSQGGTGLGLALSRRFIELMGGTLTLESAPGKGSAFTIILPTR